MLRDRWDASGAGDRTRSQGASPLRDSVGFAPNFAAWTRAVDGRADPTVTRPRAGAAAPGEATVGRAAVIGGTFGGAAACGAAAIVSGPVAREGQGTRCEPGTDAQR